MAADESFLIIQTSSLPLPLHPIFLNFDVLTRLIARHEKYISSENTNAVYQ